MLQQEDLERLGGLVKERLAPFGLDIERVDTFVPGRFQTRRNGLCLRFMAATHKRMFFGNPYENRRRIRLIEEAYAAVGGELSRMLPRHEIYLDASVRLDQPYDFSPVPFPEQQHAEGNFVDVTENSDVVFEKLASLIERGEMDADSSLAVYCAKYDIPHVLKHGACYISPDTASVEVLEAVHSALLNPHARSVIEIGGGVGICGRAAENLGIGNFMFVDVSPVVCAYLKEYYRYPVVCADGLNLPFNPKSKRRWDLVLMGMPYELNPWFLQKYGNWLASRCDVVFFNSGSPCFFEFEHDWLMGDDSVRAWPWFRETQTLRQYFPFVRSVVYDWQLGIIGARDQAVFDRVSRALIRRNFGTTRTSCLSL